LVSPVRSLFRDDPWSSLTRVNIGHERSSAQAPEQPLPVQLDLLERDTELAAVTGLIAATPGGGRLLAIEGPPGIGKTALMAAAKALAQEAGLQVLAARGSELERSFSYGVVRQLFEPLLASVQAEERADLLAGSAAFAAPLFDSAQVAADPAVDSSLATLHGLYWLTANLAARRPLLLAVDDLHWCDLPSLRWLAYLLPRMEGLGLLVVVGLRPAEPGEDPGLIGQIVSDPLATTVRPAPLSAEAVARLLRESLSPDADDAFCAACEEATGGNPLLLRELVHTIADEGLAPTEANVPRLRDLAARAGSRAVSLRLSRLPPETTTLAQAVAILGDDADPRQAATLADLDEQAASEAAAALARVDVLRPQPPLGFVHPLIRAAVYEALTPLERDRGHARAARLLADAGAESERVAAHLLRTPPAADAQVVATLRDAARRAGSRGASESAVAYLRRALAEPPLAAERADLLLELGSAETLVDGDAAVEHLREAHALIDDPIRRAETANLLGRQLFLLRGEEADAVFTQALVELDGADAELERLLEAGLIISTIFVPSLHRAALERLARVRNRPADATFGEKLLLAQVAYHDARAGTPAAVAVPLARRALAEGTLVREDVDSAAFVLAATVLAMADLDEALAVYEDALAQAHRRGSTFAFAITKVFRAQTFVFRGDLAEAEAEGREALAAGEAWGTTARFLGPHSAAFLAEALMEQGKLDDAAAALARAGIGESLPDDARLLFFPDVRAHLRMLKGDLAGGLEEMLDTGRRFEAVGSRNPAFMAWRSPAALALLQLGEQDEARRLAAEELELARTWGAPRALGAALRAAGLVEGGEHGLGLLEEAVQVLSNSPAKLEQAKARTELGAALRRANRRSEAREQLRRALELATICGAAPLAARAEIELLATGARPRRIALSGVASLTPSERRVAEMAAEGPTNREIAQTLYVTQRTVEVHLTSIYRKLAISSRSQLAAALAEPARA
jgi:DNA-binding CsgD family transcriptional regulator/tetratricopeptide (TPR) repeat protein